jgi:hypothetical protein
MPGLSPVADYRQQKYLNPNMTNEMWYWAMSDQRPSGIRLMMHYMYPSVPLDQSTWIEDVSCSGNTVITGRFTNSSAYTFAKGKWAHTSPVIFVTSASTCSSDGQNAWFNVSSVSFTASNQSFTATALPCKMDDVCKNMNIDFGPNMNMQGPGMTGFPAKPSGTVSTATKPVKTASSTYGAQSVAPPSSSISGMPAAAAGPGFDQRLDDHLGYYYDDNQSQNVSEHH